MAGVATEKPGYHPYPEGVFCIPQCSYWLNRNLNMTLFICSLKLGVDTEKPRIQMAAFNTWFPYLMIITFQCFSCGSKVSYRKALVCLHKELSLSNVKYFAVLEWVFGGGGVELEVPVHVLYCSGLLLSS